MSSWAELFKLGLVQVTLSPNPFASGKYFNQTLDLSTGTVLVYAGGSDLASYAVLVSVWADANSDTLYVDVEARDPSAAYKMVVDVTSTRPSTLWT